MFPDSRKNWDGLSGVSKKGVLNEGMRSAQILWVRTNPETGQKSQGFTMDGMQLPEDRAMAQAQLEARSMSHDPNIQYYLRFNDGSPDQPVPKG